MITITVNDEARQIAPASTIRDLLDTLELGTGRVAVEVNKQLVTRTLHEEHQLREGDRVEIVTLVGGG